MSKQPFFAVFQLTRSRNFALSTLLYDDKSRKVVIKRPIYNEGKLHLANMVATYHMLTKPADLLPGIMVAPAQQMTDGSVEFGFIQGQSVERILIDRILDNKNSEAVAIINKLISMIDNLPIVKCNPGDNAKYIEAFGDSYKGEVECSKLGLVDFNLDNIIEDSGGKWHLIDYEWSFDFPIPKELLIQRFFYWFFVKRYQSVIRYHADRIPQLLMAENVSIPEYIYNEFKPHLTNLDRAVEAESCFQSFVTGNKSPLETIDFYTNDDQRVKAIASEGYLNEIQASLLEFNAKLEKLQKELDDSSLQNAQLQTELKNIHASRAYKAAKKISRAKQTITRNGGSS